MATIYSTVFISELGLSGTHSYVCPSDRLLVLRDLDAYAETTVAARDLWLMGSRGQTIFHDSWGAPDQHNAAWRGRQIINPGDSFSVRTTDNVDVTVSGYLLTLP